MPKRGITRSRRAAVLLAAVTLSLSLAACQEGKSESGDDTENQAAGESGSGGTEDDAAPAAEVSSNVAAGGQNVKVDTPVSVSVTDGTLTDVVVKAKKTTLKGSLNADKTMWTASELLEPGTTYVVKSSASNSEGVETTSRSTFSTQNLTLDQQTYASLTPLQNETVGVGMPVIVQFDLPVKNKAEFEQHMKVTAQPATDGSWSWISDTEAHWRPKHYWKSGTRVHVDVDVNSLPAGKGIYGQMNRTVDFKIGQSVIMKTDVSTDQMKVLIDGKLARTIPITGGKPGFETRSGTKLIIEKFAVKRMNAVTVGIKPGDPEFYDIPDVQYAQRVTYSGEFIHAAPWSSYAQGVYNMSHGCVGVSTENGAWLFSVTHRGDPVEVTGSSRGLEQGNGWTDWDQTYKEFKAGSALS
jgi:lipoprotein-anchoring transpeptidase ErfK/SrfK